MDSLSEFGQCLISNVRDRVICDLEKIISGQVSAEKDILFKERISKLSQQDVLLIKELSIYLIDQTLHNTLFMFETSDDFCILNDKNENIAEISDGLCGELYTHDGWINKFSDYPSSIP